MRPRMRRRRAARDRAPAGRHGSLRLVLRRPDTGPQRLDRARDRRRRTSRRPAAGGHHDPCGPDGSRRPSPVRVPRSPVATAPRDARRRSSPGSMGLTLPPAPGRAIGAGPDRPRREAARCADRSLRRLRRPAAPVPRPRRSDRADRWPLRIGRSPAGGTHPPRATRHREPRRAPRRTGVRGKRRPCSSPASRASGARRQRRPSGSSPRRRRRHPPAPAGAAP